MWNLSMNKFELIDAVAKSADISRVKAALAVNGVTSAVTEALSGGDQVSIVGFGTFSVRNRSARIGRNPRTGEEIKIAEAKIPSFKPGKALKDAVNLL